MSTERGLQLSLPLSATARSLGDVKSTLGTARQKELGAFYTPATICNKLVEWALRMPGDTILDPSFGGLAFLEASADRLVALGQTPETALKQVFGIDLDPVAFDQAMRSALPLRPENLRLRDFFEVSPLDFAPVDAVIGNPPYIRYQGFNAGASRSRELALAKGVRLTRLASSWAAFVVHGTSFVKHGGRVAQVLPAELLHAQYAREVLEFFRRQFGHVAVVVFEERVFPGALEEVVLLCADDHGASEIAEVQLISCENVDDFDPSQVGARHSNGLSAPTLDHSKLIGQLLPTSTNELLGMLENHERVRTLGSAASVDIGVVTGANEFFMLPRTQSDLISPALMRPAVSKAAHVAGAQLTASDHKALATTGAPVSMFVADGQSAPKAMQTARAHISRGEAQGFDRRYKCRIRSPWWSLALPKAGVPDLLLTYCSNDHPRLVLNDAGVLHTNTLHGVKVTGDTNPAELAAGFFNSLTMLSAELAGRSYGGGVLKLEPSEAEALLVPHLSDSLVDLLPAVDQAIRARNLEGACDLVDPLVLSQGLGLTEDQIAELRAGRQLLRDRRKRRGKAAAA